MFNLLDFVTYSQKEEGVFVFYDRYIELCKISGKSPSRVAEEIGINKGSVSVWKKKHEKGEIAIPNAENLIAIAQYFNVSVDYLLCNESKEDKKNSTHDASAEDAEILDLIMNLPEDKKQQALDYLQYLYRK